MPATQTTGETQTANPAGEAPRRRGRPSKGAKPYHVSLPEDLKHWADTHTAGKVLVTGHQDSTSGLIQRLLQRYREEVESGVLVSIQIDNETGF